jgi:hypothetical protein
MSGDLSPGIDFKSNSWKELNDSFEECKKQLQHEMETREMLGKVISYSTQNIFVIYSLF